MKNNLDSLDSEILAFLEAQNLAVFHCELRSPDPTLAVFWDIEQHPDFRDFIRAAAQCDARIVTVFTRRFRAEQIEDALEQLAESDVEPRERRSLEKEIKAMHVYEGRVCAIELSFVHSQREYIFDLQTDWFDEFGELMDRIDTSFLGPEDDLLDGGYFSKN